MKIYLLLLLLPFVSNAQIINGSFENWFTDSLGQQRLVGWQHFAKVDLPTTLVGTSRETNSQHLNYAVKISRWYDYTWDRLLQKTSVVSNPASVTGYYKYVDNALTGERNKDTAFVRVILTRRNTVMNRTDTIGRGYIELDPSGTYRHFECPIQYELAGMADSLLIEISPSKFLDVPSYCVSPGYCSFLTLDNLSLEGTGGFTVMNSVYPNPAISNLYFQLPVGTTGSALVYNALGQKLLQQEVFAGSNNFKIGFLEPGLYFLQINTARNQTSVHKFLKN
jgi:hypothetical protein